MSEEDRSSDHERAADRSNGVSGLPIAQHSDSNGFHMGPALSTLLTAVGMAGTAVYLVAMPTYPVLIGSLVALVLSRFMPTSGWVNPQGKAVFITGCDSGFGHALATALDKMGFQVFAGCMFPDEDGAQTLKGECSPNLHVIKIDVTNDDEVAQAVVYVRQHINPRNKLWAVVNNAGTTIIGETEWCPISQYQRIIDVNAFGVVRVSKAFLPDLRLTRGRIINIASLAGRLCYPSFTAYSMSKHACVAFSDGLRREMIKFGVKVITIEPGLYKTAMTAETALLGGCRRSWEASTPEIKSYYGAEYFNSYLEKMSRVLQKCRPNTDEVVDLMIESVLAVDPAHRYVPHWPTKLRVSMFANLPYNISDVIVTKFLTPKVLPKCKTL